MQRYKKILKPPNKITSKYLEIKSKPTFLLRKWVNCYIIAKINAYYWQGKQ